MLTTEEKLKDYEALKLDWRRLNKELTTAHLVTDVLLAMFGLVSLAVLILLCVGAQYFGGMGF